MTKKLLTALAVLSLGTGFQSAMHVTGNVAKNTEFAYKVAQNSGQAKVVGEALFNGMKSQLVQAATLWGMAAGSIGALKAYVTQVAEPSRAEKLKELAGKIKVSKKQAMVGAGVLAVAGATVAAVKHAKPSEFTVSNIVKSAKPKVVTPSFDDIVKSSNGNIMLAVQGLRRAGCTKANVEKIDFSGFSKGNVAYIKSQLNA